MSWFSQTIENLIKSQTDKIDSVAVNGLSGVVDSLAYKVHELEKHFHNSEQVFGNNVNYMGADVPIPFVVEGGDNAWGTELMITMGTTIESGSATKKFDFNQLYVTAVDDADEVSIIEFLYGTAGATIEDVVTDDSSDNFTKAGHGLVNGDKVIVTDLVTTTGLNAYTVYYVIGMSGDSFQLSLTLGGAAIVLGTGDGTCDLKKLTQTSLTKKVIAAASVTTNAIPYILSSPRIPCNSYLFVRAKSETGTTVAISFLMGLHTYTA